MMIIESAMAARFAAGTNVRPSTGMLYDMNGLVNVPSCRLAYSSSFDMPRFQNSNGSPFTRRGKLVNYRIQASTEHPGSAQDPAKQNGKLSYHPFEELTESTSANNGDARLTAEETSRTIIEVNSKGTVIFSSPINEVQENIIWPDLPYLTDENGNIYFMVKNGEDVLQSLTSENNFVQVIVGVDTMEMISEMDLSGPSEIDFGIEELDDQDSDDLDENDEEEEDEDENNDYDSGWAAVISDEDEEDDDDDSLADWAKLDTMRSSHPMYFAKKLAEIASDAPVDWMEQPPAALAIQGIIRPAFIEEHSVIQKHLSGSQSSNTDISKSKENKEDLGVINGHVHNSGSSMDDAAQVENIENLEIPVNETSFYKLDMTKIQLFSAHGHPTFVEVEDYMKAQPDAIAHSVSKIISRLKAGGEKTLQALKSLCWICKGVQVEEAQIISVDCLGFDLRVCSGAQIQTLRFAFKKKAMSEYSAERQLNDLLFPRIQQKVQTLNQTTHQNEF